MINRPLAAVAVATLLLSPAWAQTQTAPAPGAQTAPAAAPQTRTTTGASPAFTDMQKQSQWLGSQLIGAKVVNNADESIGEINDLLVDDNGMVQAAVIGVGGFLGIGEKDVAVDFEKVTWVDRDDDRWLVFAATKEDLEAAPEFDRTVFAAESDENQAASQAGESGTEENGDMAASNQKAGEEKGDRVAADQESGEMNAADEQASDEMHAADDEASESDAAEAEVDESETTAAVPDADESVIVDEDAAEAAVDENFNEGWTVVERGTLSAEELIGTRVYGADRADLGEIGDVIVNADGNVEAYIIDVGGFLGLGEKPVALDSAELEVMQDESGDLRIVTNFTEEQLESHVAYTKEAYEADRETVLLR